VGLLALKDTPQRVSTLALNKEITDAVYFYPQKKGG
jgi:hypothetical protein